MAKRARQKGKRDLREPGRLEAEAMALGLFALAGFVELSLLSYAPGDPWWGFGSPVENRCGPVGALIAAGLAGLLGWASHVLPLAASVVGVRYLRGKA